MQVIYRLYYQLQRGPLTAQGLGAFRFIPDPRIFKFPQNFCQAFCLFSILKDTPSALHYALASLLSEQLWDLFLTYQLAYPYICERRFYYSQNRKV